MNKFKKSFDNAGVYIIVMSIIAIVLRVLDFNKNGTFGMVDAIVSIIGLVFGLIYAFKGHLKDSAKFYKIFIVLYAVSTIVSLVSYYTYVKNALSVTNIIILIGHIVVMLGALLLATIKDFGKKNSTNVVNGIALINLLILFITLVSDLNFIYIALCNLVLSCIEKAYVDFKYQDKEARGAD